ncbi:hypothetical protein ACJ41O_007481 [Fusarium nematophilum]
MTTIADSPTQEAPNMMPEYEVKFLLNPTAALGPNKELTSTVLSTFDKPPSVTKQVCLPTSRTVDSERLRLCVSFSRKRQSLLAMASSRSRTSLGSAYASTFKKLQKQSRTLHAALKSRFSCSCNDRHRCGIWAQWEKSKLESKGPSLNFLIDGRYGRKQVRWEVEAVDRAEPLMPRDEQHSLDQIYELDWQTQLLRQKKDLVKAAQDGKPAALALSSFAMVSNLSNTNTENIQADWVKSLKNPVKSVKSATDFLKSGLPRGSSSTGE